MAIREIIFRGRTEDGLWAYGDLEHTGKNKPYWVDAKKIIPETVGQFTGLIDKNGKKIFEGDILYIKASHGIECVVGNAIVYYDKELFQYRVRSTKPFGIIYCDFTHIDRFEVIGNIHDNPELLKVVKE